MTVIQVALDFDNARDALRVAKRVKRYVEIFEAGTPLLKAEGEKTIIPKLKKIAFGKKIFADLKTMDTGSFETEGAMKLGAYYSSVLGVASNETIKSAINSSKKGEVVVDLIQCKNIARRVKELKLLGAKNFEVHTAIDDQLKGKNPLVELKEISRIKEINVWVAGGISMKNIDKVMKYNPKVVVVGGAITKAKNPENAAKEIYRAIYSK